MLLTIRHPQGDTVSSGANVGGLDDPALRVLPRSQRCILGKNTECDESCRDEEAAVGGLHGGREYHAAGK